MVFCCGTACEYTSGDASEVIMIQTDKIPILTSVFFIYGFPPEKSSFVVYINIPMKRIDSLNIHDICTTSQDNDKKEHVSNKKKRRGEGMLIFLRGMARRG